jgi:DNA-binding NarL/FixJ family response regulator
VSRSVVSTFASRGAVLEEFRVIRVLVADDDSAVRSALADLLSVYPDFDVVATCVDGADALRQLEFVTPDLAVLDVRMPSGGADLVREFTNRGIGVVCFSADEESARNMLDAGASAFIAKNGDGLNFARTLRSVMER